MWGFQLSVTTSGAMTLHYNPLLLWNCPAGRPGDPSRSQAMKTGLVLLLHRETGTPLAPVKERPVPESDVPGESGRILVGRPLIR